MNEKTTFLKRQGASPCLAMSAEGLKQDFEHHLRRTLAKDRYTATDRDRYYAFALAVRDRLIERWIATQQTHHKQHVKRIYYLSLEFLIGRSLGNNVMNLHLEDSCRQAMDGVGSIGTTSSTRKSMRAWAMAAWAAWPPALWIPSPPLNLPRSDMACAMTLASSTSAS